MVAGFFRVTCNDARGRRAGATIAALDGLRAEEEALVPSAVRKFQSMPAISEVDRADDHLGRLLSALDSLTSELERYEGPAIPIEDYVFLKGAGVAIDEEPEAYVDPSIIARLLVFADELETDAEAIQGYGRRMRASLLSIYRERVFEPSGRSRVRDA